VAERSHFTEFGHHQGPDRRNPLLDEDAATGCCGDGHFMVLASNLTRVMNIVGIQPLMAALRHSHRSYAFVCR
jgi:hypothetical protein